MRRFSFKNGLTLFFNKHLKQTEFNVNVLELDSFVHYELSLCKEELCEDTSKLL